MIGRVTGSLARVDRRAGMAVVQLGGERRQLVPLVEHLGELDQELERVEYRHALRPLLDALPERERTILMLRFFGEMTQTQIAEQIGVSQMHVSRLLSRTLSQLRAELIEQPQTG
jgi:RNA polymerase sigma-B factor